MDCFGSLPVSGFNSILSRLVDEDSPVWGGWQVVAPKRIRWQRRFFGRKLPGVVSPILRHTPKMESGFRLLDTK